MCFIGLLLATEEYIKKVKKLNKELYIPYSHMFRHLEGRVDIFILGSKLRKYFKNIFLFSELSLCVGTGYIGLVAEFNAWLLGSLISEDGCIHILIY